MSLARVAVPLAALAAAIGVAAILFALRPGIQATPPEFVAPLVRVIAVESGPQRLVVRTHGEVAPRTEIELAPEVAGRVVWVSPNLVSGGFLEEGEPLMRLDPLDYQVALEEARANLVRARSEAARAAKELDRRRTLVERDVASASLLDDAENAARVSRSAVQQARAVLRRAERDLKRTEIHAPFPGRVRSERVDVGQFVSRGAPVAKLYAIDFAEVRVPIGDEQLAHLEGVPLWRREEEGPPVRLRAEFAGRAHAWQGRVVRTEGEIDPRSRMVHVVVRVEDPYARSRGSGNGVPLAVGLFVEAEMQGRLVPDAVRLPRTALREGEHVWSIDAEDRLRVRPVDVIWQGPESVVVQGLGERERICLTRLPVMVDGMRVRPTPGESRSEMEAS